MPRLSFARRLLLGALMLGWLGALLGGVALPSARAQVPTTSNLGAAWPTATPYTAQVPLPSLDYYLVPTPYPSSTPYPTATPCACSRPPTLTPVPTLTPYPTLTPRPTYTPMPTYTPGPTLTAWPTFSPTSTPTATPTATPTP